VAAVALAIDVKARTGSGLWVGAVIIVEFLPTIVVGLLLGPLLGPPRALGDDRRRRSAVSLRGALPFDGTNGWTIDGGVTGDDAAVDAADAAALYRLLEEQVVPAEELPRANALLQTVENLSWAIGPLIGGILTAVAGPNLPYAINAASFLASIALVVRIPPRLLQSERALSRGHWRDLGDGFLAAFRSPSLRSVLVAWVSRGLAWDSAQVATVFLAKNTFSAGDFGYGLLYGATGVGLVPAA
jgi:hypothetical protein